MWWDHCALQRNEKKLFITFITLLALLDRNMAAFVNFTLQLTWETLLRVRKPVGKGVGYRSKFILTNASRAIYKFLCDD